MKKTITNKELIQIFQRISSLSQNTYPFQISRSIVKTSYALREEYQIYLNHFRSIGDEYFWKDENGNYKIDQNGGYILNSKTDSEKVFSILNELLQEKVEDVEFVQFSENEMEKIKEITPEDYEFFEKYLIKEENRKEQ